jgi:hypothetical protein
MIGDRELPAPMWVLSLASMVQSAVLLALAVLTGVALATKVGLKAPVLSTLDQWPSALAHLRPQLIPGLVGGVSGAVLLWLFARYAPHALAQVQDKFSLSLIVRALYGGITEELLIRWGLMTLLVWVFWRYGGGGIGAPSTTVVWLAISLSAVLFGLGHLPAAAATIGPLSPPVVAYIVTGNSAFGLIAGYLYWRYGLESAIVAHALAHVLAFLVGR